MNLREINLPLQNTFSFDVKIHEIKGGYVTFVADTSSADIGTLELSVARRNGGHIIVATTSVEANLEKAIEVYFMGAYEISDDRRNFFVTEILQTNSLTFHAKKQLFTKIVNSTEALKGKDKSRVGSSLKNVMDWRNMFAHGKLIHEAKRGCVLQFYSGQPREQVLDEEFWSSVENEFGKVIELMAKVQSNIESCSKPQLQESAPLLNESNSVKTSNSP
jgi:hypothetical protein